MRNLLFEYLYMKKPILAVLEAGTLWDMLERAGVISYNPEEVGQIEQLLSLLLNDFRAGRRLPVPSGLPDLNKYSRQITAKRLAETVEHLLADQKI